MANRNLTKFELSVLRHLVGKDQPLDERPSLGAAYNQACEVLEKMGYVKRSTWLITSEGLAEMEEYE